MRCKNDYIFVRQIKRLEYRWFYCLQTRHHIAYWSQSELRSCLRQQQHFRLARHPNQLTLLPEPIILPHCERSCCQHSTTRHTQTGYPATDVHKKYFEKQQLPEHQAPENVGPLVKPSGRRHLHPGNPGRNERNSPTDQYLSLQFIRQRSQCLFMSTKRYR